MNIEKLAILCKEFPKVKCLYCQNLIITQYIAYCACYDDASCCVSFRDKGEWQGNNREGEYAQ
jgi:hypothetical protein